MARLISCLMLFVAYFPFPAQADVPTTPGSVLPYLESVYTRGDIDAYAELLASDYRFVLEDVGASWDAATDVKATRKLFEAASAELSFSKDISVKPGLQPRTWIIEDLVCTLVVTQKKDGKVWRVENTVSFIVRDEKGKIRITEWRQHPSE